MLFYKSQTVALNNISSLRLSPHRITAQRSVEDAEEVERERRRRAWESFRSMGSSSTLGPGGPSLDNGALAEDGL